MDKNKQRKRNKKTVKRQLKVVPQIDPRDKEIFKKGTWLNVGSNPTGARYSVLIKDVKRIV